MTLTRTNEARFGVAFKDAGIEKEKRGCKDERERQSPSEPQFGSEHREHYQAAELCVNHKDKMGCIHFSH